RGLCRRDPTAALISAMCLYLFTRVALWDLEGRARARALPLPRALPALACAARTPRGRDAGTAAARAGGGVDHATCPALGTGAQAGGAPGARDPVPLQRRLPPLVRARERALRRLSRRSRLRRRPSPRAARARNHPKS